VSPINRKPTLSGCDKLRSVNISVEVEYNLADGVLVIVTLICCSIGHYTKSFLITHFAQPVDQSSIVVLSVEFLVLSG
jgi:hypothetical protein